MGKRIHVEESELIKLKGALESAGANYKMNLAKLKNLIDEITAGDIQGDVANDLRNKFMAKQDDFNSLTKSLEDAEQYTGAKGTSFVNMVSDLKSTMK